MSEETKLIQRPSVNPTVTNYELSVRGYLVPYMKISKYPCLSDSDSSQVYQEMHSHSEESEDGQNCSGGMELRWFVKKDESPLPSDFVPSYRWSIILDRRLMWEFDSEEDTLHAATMAADAMAIAAGFTAHGYTTRKNLHGPTIMETNSELVSP